MNNQPQTNYIQEDEIDLVELFNSLMKRKVFILSFVSIVTLLSIVYVFSATKIYEVKSNIQVGLIAGEPLDEAGVLAKTIKVVFHVDEEVYKDGEEFVSKVESVSVDKQAKNFIEVATRGISNEEALSKNKEVVEYAKSLYAQKIDFFKKQKQLDIELTKKRIELNNKKIQNTKKDDSASFLLISENSQLQQKLLETQSTISEFQTHNTDIVGGYLIKPKPIKPKKKLIVVVSFITSFILAIFISFFLDFIDNVKRGAKQD